MGLCRQFHVPEPARSSKRERRRARHRARNALVASTSDGTRRAMMTLIRPLYERSGGVDRNCSEPARAQDAMELREAGPRRVREEHEAKTAQQPRRSCHRRTLSNWPSSTTTAVFGESARRWRARLTMAGETSAATWPPGPTTARAAWAAIPVPVATSSTR